MVSQRETLIQTWSNKESFVADFLFPTDAAPLNKYEKSPIEG